jgi:hypothetical protein
VSKNLTPRFTAAWSREVISCLSLDGRTRAIADLGGRSNLPTTIFLPKGKAHAFYIRSEYPRTLIISLAFTEQPAALDRYFASMAKRATSMDIPTDAVNYLTDDPLHAVQMGKKYGIKMLSPEDASRHISAGSA